MVFEGAHEHDRAFLSGDLFGQLILEIELSRDAETEYRHKMGNGPGGSGAIEDHCIVVTRVTTVLDDLAGLFSEARRLQSGPRRFGVGVGVERKHSLADVILNEGQCTARSCVVGVDNASRTKRTLDHLVLADY